MAAFVALPKITIPSRKSHLLSRPRLLTFLEAHVDRKLILVSALAGYGKTSLLVQFASQSTLPVCWYSLDERDRDPQVFLEYVVAAVRRQFPEALAQTSALLRSPLPFGNLSTLSAMLLNDLQSIPAYFVFVLDDFHIVQSSELVGLVMNALIADLPENVHFVVASRTVPTIFPIARLTARQEIAGLSSEMLRFQVDELQSLAEQNHWAALTPEAAQGLVEYAEGWITGILMANKKGRAPGDLGLHRQDEAQLFDYLATEVLNLEGMEVRRFLLETSLLDSLSPSVAKLLWGEQAVAILEAIEARNLFLFRIEGEVEITWRYHPLFRHFLKHQFRVVDAAGEQAWQKRIAEMFEAQAQWDLALGHFQQAGLVQEMARCLDRAAAEMVNQGHHESLAKWIGEVPASFIRHYPHILVNQARMHCSQGARVESEACLVQAQMEFRRLNDTAGVIAVLIQRAAILQEMGQLQDAIAGLRQALQLAGPEDYDTQARIHRYLGTGLGRMGELEGSLVELNEALRCHAAAGTPGAEVGAVHHEIGVALRTMGRPEAEGHFLTALQMYGEGANYRMRCLTLNSLGIGFYHRMEYERALQALHEARDEAARQGDRRNYGTVMASIGDVHRDQRNLTQAHADYSEALTCAEEIKEGFLKAYALVALAELDCRQRHLARAEERLGEAFELAKTHRSRYETILARLGLGYLETLRGNRTKSDAHLHAAADLAREGGFKREYIRVGLHLASNALADPEGGDLQRWMQQVAQGSRDLNEMQTVVGELDLVRAAVDKAIALSIEDTFFQMAVRQAPRPSPASPLPIALTVAEPEIRVQAFGNGLVWVAGQAISMEHWGRHAAWELFFLVLSDQEGMRKDRILDVLWPDMDAAKAQASLYPLITKIRAVIPSKYFVRDGGRYVLRRGDWLSYDVDGFEQMLSAAEIAVTPCDKVAPLRAAARLYRGSYLESCYGDWPIPQRTRLEQRAAQALQTLAHIEQELGNEDQAIDALERILGMDEYNDRVIRALMQLYVQRGNRRGAVDVYEQLAQRLEHDYALKPESETTGLYRRILQDA